MTTFKEGFVRDAMNEKHMLSSITNDILKEASEFSDVVAQLCLDDDRQERLGAFYKLRTDVRYLKYLEPTNSIQVRNDLLAVEPLNLTLGTALLAAGYLEVLLTFIEIEDEKIEASKIFSLNDNIVTRLKMIKDPEAILNLKHVVATIRIDLGPTSFITKNKQAIFDLEVEYRNLLANYLSDFKDLEESDQDQLDNCLIFLTIFNKFGYLLETERNRAREAKNGGDADDEAR